MNIVSLVLGGDINRIEELRKKIMETVTEEAPFWGFDEEGCDAPPKSMQKLDGQIL